MYFYNFPPLDDTLDGTAYIPSLKENNTLDGAVVIEAIHLRE